VTCDCEQVDDTVLAVLLAVDHLAPYASQC